VVTVSKKFLGGGADLTCVHDPLVRKTIEHLINNQGSTLSNANVNHYLNYLKEQYKDKVDFIREYFVGNREDTINQQSMLTKIMLKMESSHSWELLFIPFAFKGKFQFYHDHIVVIIINKRRNQIQYYDPQALLPSDPYRRVFQGFSMQVFLDELKGEFAGEEFEIVYNRIFHQEDINNCAVYILDCIERMAGGEKFEEICTNGKGSQLITQVRDQMAVNLYKTPPSSKDIEEGRVSLVHDGEDF